MIRSSNPITPNPGTGSLRLLNGSSRLHSRIGKTQRTQDESYISTFLVVRLRRSLPFLSLMFKSWKEFGQSTDFNIPLFNRILDLYPSGDVPRIVIWGRSSEVDLNNCLTTSGLYPTTLSYFEDPDVGITLKYKRMSEKKSFVWSVSVLCVSSQDSFEGRITINPFYFSSLMSCPCFGNLWRETETIPRFGNRTSSFLSLVTVPRDHFWVT